MSNLFAQTRNQFRLYDVNGTVLASPNDYIVIREPDGFKDIPITLERDRSTHGVFFEFGDENQPLGFDRAMFVDGEADDPYTLIKSIYDTDGVDGKLEFELLNWNGTIYVSQYKAYVDLESISIVDYIIKVNTRRILLSDKFRTRLETPVDFGATTSIDGTSIGSVSEESMFLHGKNNFLEQVATSLNFQHDFFIFDQDDWILQFDHTQSSNVNDGDLSGFDNSVFRKYGVGNFSQLYNIGSDLSLINPHLEFKDVAGVLSISWRSVYRMSISGTVATNGEHFGSFVKVNDTEYQIGSAQGTGGSANPFVKDIDVFDTADVFVPKGAKVSFYEKWGFFTNLNSNSTASIGVGFGGNDDKLELEFTEFVESSFADTYPIFDSVNHILEAINDSNDVLESSFLSTELADMYFANGYKIRNFADRSLTSSFKDIFTNGLQNIFGLGYTIYDNSGYKVLIERYSEFYQDDEIDYIDVVEDGSFEIKTDKEYRFNEIKTGYKDFPKATDENKNNNLDEVNTVHEHITPIETVKKKKDYISDIIASGYLIENQRREQFKDVPEDTVTNDDKPFIINAINSDEYTGLTVGFVNLIVVEYIDINATYLNLSVGDVITLSGTTSNNSSFTIEEISNNLIGNTSFNLGVRLTVTEAITTGALDTNVTLEKSASFLRALRDEEFETLTDVISPDTSYNIGLNPKYMLFNHSPLINSGFNPKAGTDEVKTQEVKLNGEMTCRFASGEGAYVLDPDRETVTMNEELALDQLNNYDRLFTGNLIKFTASIGYDRVLTIRDAYLNQALSDNFGYIRVSDGTSDYTGFLNSMNYNPLTEKVDFELIERYV